METGNSGMRAGVGYSDIPDSIAAGKQAAENAVGMAGRGEPCDIVFLFCTARHDQQRLREAVASVVGEGVPIYGGGAVGAITNEAYGYAGDQVGIACLWLEGSRCAALLDGGLSSGEEGAGFRLGRELARLGAVPDSAVMLLYNSVHHEEAGMRMLMATWIMQGLEKALGFLPAIYGAGMMSDHTASPAGQYIGRDASMKDEHYAMAFMFSEDIHIDSVIMHGCRPASPYYTVTRAEGPVLLEINHRPALSFMEELLGPSLKPEEYPFFLLFGINHGERSGEYDESNYASRLCLGIDRERSGIVMFEPDMVAGTEFQVMNRSFDLGYMRPKIESLFEGLEGREAVFGMYFDCAGRCAGFGGTDMEDALVLQQTVAGRVPLLGIYTGVEIAPIAGRSRGLDVTGVFCLFSQGRKKASVKPGGAASKAVGKKPRQSQRQLLEAMQKLCERNMRKMLELDSRSIQLRYELELKRRGFRLLAELALALRQEKNDKSLFSQMAERINATLNMQKTLVFLADESGSFSPVVLRGFSLEEREFLATRVFEIPQDLLLHPLVVTAEDSPERFAALRAACNLPFFAASPVLLQGKTVALLLTGRTQEVQPYLPRLGRGDLEILQAIGELLGSVLIRRRLSDITFKAETDSLTGLWNRAAFQRMVEDYLGTGRKRAGAFMVIDVDYFKTVNDRYGHIVGDAALVACAEAMQRVLRNTDIICRQGGDEFTVFCRGIKERRFAVKKAAQIQEAWQKIIPTEGSRHITASIGIALAPQHGASFQELYLNADAAMYKAKKRGRDCHVCCGDPALH